MAAALRLVRSGSCTCCSSVVSSRPCAIAPVSVAPVPSMLSSPRFTSCCSGPGGLIGSSSMSGGDGGRGGTICTGCSRGGGGGGGSTNSGGTGSATGGGGAGGSGAITTAGVGAGASGPPIGIDKRMVVGVACWISLSCCG